MQHCTLTCWCTLYYVGFITLSLLHIRLVTRQYGAIWWYSWSAATGLQSITCPDGWPCGISVMESQSPRPCVMRPVWLDATSPKGHCGKMWFRYKPLGLVSWCWCDHIASDDRVFMMQCIGGVVTCRGGCVVIWPTLGRVAMPMLPMYDGWWRV